MALVGESGSGKSSVISLLQRFYDPDSGHITLDGIEIQKFQVKWLRRQMGLVSQEPVLFNDTIRANIAYGKEGKATEAEIVEAAELANAHKFISGLQQVRPANFSFFFSSSTVYFFCFGQYAQYHHPWVILCLVLHVQFQFTVHCSLNFYMTCTGTCYVRLK